MNELLLLLAQNALLLVAGTTLLLLLGCGGVILCKSPVHRQRISELTIAGVLGWMVLALFPLPRLLPLVVSSEGRAAIPEAMDAVPSQEIPATAPELIPDVRERMQEETVVEGFEAADGQVTPFYISSPSEEFSPIAKSPAPRAAEIESASISSSWSFDLEKLAGLFTGAYLAGAFLCVLWILAGHALLLRIRQTAEAPREWLTKLYRSLAKQSGITPPQLIVSRLCARPLTWGVLWPVVVLPQSLCRQENKSQLETILLHELGHIAQQDAQGNLLFCAALPLLYAHPLYWWLRRESQLAAELVADDWAAQQTGKETYVEELVALARCTGRSAIPLVGVTGLFSSPSLFYRRMQMLLAREKPLSTKTSLPWRLASLSALAGAVALAASLAGVRPAVGQAPPATTPPAVAPAPALTPPVTAPAAEPPAVPVPALPTAPRASQPPGATPAVAPVASEPPAETKPVPAPPTGVVPPTPATDPAEATLLREIQDLKEKLRALEQKRRPEGTGTWSTTGIKAVNVKGETVELHRVDEQGRSWSEVWATDEKGQPNKIISKSLHRKQPPVIAADGKTVVREEVEKDGSLRTIILDAATGKIIAENHSGGAHNPRSDADVVPPDSKPGKPIVERVPSVEYPIPVVGKGPRAVMTTPSATYQYGPVMPQPAGVPNVAQADRQLDLVSLATSYADAVSVLEAAEAKMAENAKLKDSNVISAQELTSAKLALSAAKRKEQLLRSIAEVATDSAARNFERISRSGSTTDAAAAEAQSRLDILKQILNTRHTDATPAKP